MKIYYSQRCLTLIGAIEDKKKQMFHVIYPGLQKDYETACDQQNGRAMMFLHSKLCKIVDELE